jgi:hypothetical protein
MKTIVLFLAVSLSAWAQESSTKVDQVRSFQIKSDTATVTFWGSNQVYRIPGNSRLIPCLENAWKTDKEVLLMFNKDANVLMGCKLYSGGGRRR